METSSYPFSPHSRRPSRRPSRRQSTKQSQAISKAYQKKSKPSPIPSFFGGYLPSNGANISKSEVDMKLTPKGAHGPSSGSLHQNTAYQSIPPNSTTAESMSVTSNNNYDSIPAKVEFTDKVQKQSHIEENDSNQTSNMTANMQKSINRVPKLSLPVIQDGVPFAFRNSMLPTSQTARLPQTTSITPERTFSARYNSSKTNYVTNQNVNNTSNMKYKKDMFAPTKPPRFAESQYVDRNDFSLFSSISSRRLEHYDLYQSQLVDDIAMDAQFGRYSKGDLGRLHGIESSKQNTKTPLYQNKINYQSIKSNQSNELSNYTQNSSIQEDETDQTSDKLSFQNSTNQPAELKNYGNPSRNSHHASNDYNSFTSRTSHHASNDYNSFTSRSSHHVSNNPISPTAGVSASPHIFVANYTTDHKSPLIQEKVKYSQEQSLMNPSPINAHPKQDTSHSMRQYTDMNSTKKPSKHLLTPTRPNRPHSRTAIGSNRSIGLNRTRELSRWNAQRTGNNFFLLSATFSRGTKSSILHDSILNDTSNSSEHDPQAFIRYLNQLGTDSFCQDATSSEYLLQTISCENSVPNDNLDHSIVQSRHMDRTRHHAQEKRANRYRRTSHTSRSVVSTTQARQILRNQENGIETASRDQYLEECQTANVIPFPAILRGLAQEELNIAGFGIGKLGIQPFCKALSINHTVRKLDLSRNNLGCSGTTILARAIEANAAAGGTLTELYVGSNTISSVGAHALCFAIALHPCMRVFAGPDNCMTDGVSPAMECMLRPDISAQCRIETLDLRGQKLGDTFLKTLIHCLAPSVEPEVVGLPYKEQPFQNTDTGYSKGSTQVPLSKNSMNSVGQLRLKSFNNAPQNISERTPGKSLTSNLSQLNFHSSNVYKAPTLRKLQLSWNNFSDDIMRSFMLALATGNESLEELDIAWTPLYESGGMAIACLLLHHPRLHRLNISHCALTPTTGIIIGDALRFNTTLLDLNISCNALGVQAGNFILEMCRNRSPPMQTLGLVSITGYSKGQHFNLTDNDNPSDIEMMTRAAQGTSPTWTIPSLKTIYPIEKKQTNDENEQEGEEDIWGNGMEFDYKFPDGKFSFDLSIPRQHAIASLFVARVRKGYGTFLQISQNRRQLMDPTTPHEAMKIRSTFSTSVLDRLHPMPVTGMLQAEFMSINSVQHSNASRQDTFPTNNVSPKIQSDTNQQTTSTTDSKKDKLLEIQTQYNNTIADVFESIQFQYEDTLPKSTIQFDIHQNDMNSVFNLAILKRLQQLSLMELLHANIIDYTSQIKDKKAQTVANITHDLDYIEHIMSNNILIKIPEQEKHRGNPSYVEASLTFQSNIFSFVAPFCLRLGNAVERRVAHIILESVDTISSTSPLRRARHENRRFRLYKWRRRASPSTTQSKSFGKFGFSTKIMNKLTESDSEDSDLEISPAIRTSSMVTNTPRTSFNNHADPLTSPRSSMNSPRASLNSPRASMTSPRASLMSPRGSFLAQTPTVRNKRARWKLPKSGKFTFDYVIRSCSTLMLNTYLLDISNELHLQTLASMRHLAMHLPGYFCIECTCSMNIYDRKHKTHLRTGSTKGNIACLHDWPCISNVVTTFQNRLQQRARRTNDGGDLEKTDSNTLAEQLVHDSTPYSDTPISKSVLDQSKGVGQKASIKQSCVSVHEFQLNAIPRTKGNRKGLEVSHVKYHTSNTRDLFVLETLRRRAFMCQLSICSDHNDKTQKTPQYFQLALNTFKSSMSIDETVQAIELYSKQNYPHMRPTDTSMHPSKQHLKTSLNTADTSMHFSKQHLKASTNTTDLSMSPNQHINSPMKTTDTSMSSFKQHAKSPTNTLKIPDNLVLDACDATEHITSVKIDGVKIPVQMILIPSFQWPTNVNVELCYVWYRTAKEIEIDTFDELHTAIHSQVTDTDRLGLLTTVFNQFKKRSLSSNDTIQTEKFSHILRNIQAATQNSSTMNLNTGMYLSTNMILSLINCISFAHAKAQASDMLRPFVTDKHMFALVTHAVQQAQTDELALTEFEPTN